MFKVLAVPNLTLTRFRRLGRELFWVGFGQGLAALGGMVGVRLMTNLLDPTSYGELALGMTVVILAQQLVLGPLSGAFLRFFAPAREANQLGAYLQSIQVLVRQATGVLVGLAGLLTLALCLLGHTQWLGLALAAFVFSLLSGYNSALDGVQNAARQRVVVAWHQGIGQWLRFLAAVALIAVLGASSSVAMMGYALAASLVLGSQLVFLRRKILPMMAHQAMSRQVDLGNWTKRMRSYAWPFVTWGLFTWALMTSDRWALQSFAETSDVGLYAVLYQLGYYPITLLSALIVQLVSPILFSQAGDGTDSIRVSRSRRLNNLLVLGAVLLTVFITLIAFAFHAQVFSLLVAPDYRMVSSLLPWMILSGGLFASGQIAVLSLLTSTDTETIIAPKIVTASLGGALNFCGAYWFGLRGVIAASVVFSLIYLLWILALARPSKALVAT